VSSRARKVRDAIGGAEKPKFEHGLTQAVIHPESGMLTLVRKPDSSADPIHRTMVVEIPLDDAEKLVTWLMVNYGDFESGGGEIKWKQFT
jgi:hypothetical protein